MNDPVVAEIRKAREEYARKFNYDFELMCDDWQRRQEQSGARFVSLPKRPPIVIMPPAKNSERSEAS